MQGKALIMEVLKGKTVERCPWVPYTGSQIANLKGYTAIGTDSDGYMGIFDGRGHAVIGLDAAKGDDGNRQFF